MVQKVAKAMSELSQLAVELEIFALSVVGGFV